MEIRRKALDEIKTEVRTATSSMTSVPKPLKYLRKHYDELKEFYDKCDGAFKTEVADLLSVLAITMSEKGSNESLKYVLQGTKRNLTDWGNEYLRSLSGEISAEYNDRLKNEKSTEDLNFLVDIITPFCVQHKEETEAIDLLMEVEQLHKIIDLCNDENYERMCLYIRGCAPYAGDQEEMTNIFLTCYKVYTKLAKYPEALLIAQKMDDDSMVKEVMEACQDPVVKKQLCLMLGRQRTNYETEDEALFKIISYERLSEHFRALARDLDTLEPKTPEQIFKTHLEEKKNDAKIDSFKENLATSYCNAFLNAGYGTDKLITVADENDEWIWKNKDSGMTAAAASLGMIHMWDIDEGFAKVDKYMESTNDLIRAGAYMAVGIINSGIKNDSDPVFALLSEHVESGTEYTKIGALMGLSFTYAGSAREDILELVSPIVLDGDSSIELASIAALVLGIVFLGTCNDEVANCIIQTCMEREPQDLDNPHARYFALGMGLLYFGKQDVVEASLVGVSVIDHPIARFMEIFMKGCAYACSGNVLKIQELLQICAEHVAVPEAKEDAKEGEEKKEESKNTNHFQSAAVLSLGLIAFGEDIGTEMAMRTMNHLLQYGEPEIKRAIPLAMSLLSIAAGSGTGGKNNQVMDLLGKLSYDGDSDVAINAVLAQGIIWAGTNNSRLAGNLRQLASYYSRDPDNLLMVRIAQGLVSTGKGLINFQPLHSDRNLQSNVALSGILVVLLT
jgi:26S proteasome regulatory subunit N1